MSSHMPFNQYQNCDGAHVAPLLNENKEIIKNVISHKKLIIPSEEIPFDDLYFGEDQQPNHELGCTDNPCTCFPE